MTYELVDLDGGDVLAVYRSAIEAEREAHALVEAHPDLEDDLVVIVVDDRGERAGEPIPASVYQAPAIA